MAYPVAAYSDRVDRRSVIAFGLGLFAVAYGGLALTTTPTVVWLLLPIYGLSSACTDAVVKAWVAYAIPADRRPWGIGLHQGLTGLGALIVAVWTGIAWNHTGRGPLLASAVGAVVIGALIAIRRPSDP